MPATTNPPTSTIALIIGAGPVGLYTAIALAKHGYRSVILERKTARHLEQPKAHAINSRALEIFSQTGLSVPSLRKLGTDPSDSDLVRFEQSLSGIEYGSFQYERQDEAVKEFTPEPLANIAQPKLEEFLQDHAENTGLVTIHYGWQWQSCTQEPSGPIRSEAVNPTSGHSVQIESKYLLACDGAHSRARTALGIPTRIPGGANAVAARYVSATISADWRKFRSGMLHVIIQDGVLRVFIVYNRSSKWVLMFGISHDESVDKYTEEFCRETVDKVSYRPAPSAPPR